MLVTKTWSATVVDGDQYAKELHHMGVLDDLLGNEQLQKQYKDSDKRYEQGDPPEGYSDQEVLKRYGEVSHAVLRLPRGAGQAFAGRAGGFREDAAGESCGARREAAGKGGTRSEGPGTGAY